MTLSKTYPPQGTSQNKERLQEVLEEQNIPLESVTVEYMPRFQQLLGAIDYNTPKSVSFEELPGAFQAHIDGTVTGRTLVQIS